MIFEPYAHIQCFCSSSIPEFIAETGYLLSFRLIDRAYGIN